jgi:CheY-like chemotaxis protein
MTMGREARVIGDYLRRCGYRVTHVVSGEEGLALAHHEPPDIAIVDLRLRALDGLDVIRRLRTGVAASTPPIIALTALAMRAIANAVWKRAPMCI